MKHAFRPLLVVAITAAILVTLAATATSKETRSVRADAAALSDGGDPRRDEGTATDEVNAGSAPLSGPGECGVATGLQTVVVDDVERAFLVALPAEGPMRGIVVNFHRYGGTKAGHDGYTSMGALGTARGFAVVTPLGEETAGPGSPRVFWTEQEYPTTDNPMYDTDRFVDAILTVFETAGCDRGPLFFTGWSNGAGFSLNAACFLRYDVVAVGIVARQPLVPGTCGGFFGDTKVVAFHGTADPLVAYDGAVQRLADTMYGCTDDVRESTVTDDVTLIEFPCGSGADPFAHDRVVLYRIEGGGHTWPGGDQSIDPFGGPTTQSISATEIMLDFFETQLPS